MLTVEPLSPDAFAPFGLVHAPADFPGRADADGALANLRPNARPKFYQNLIAPTATAGFAVRMMERHPDSSQTFLPVDVARYLVIVAPNGSIDRPDMTQARAFLARGDQGVTYRPGAWHHGMTVFDRAGRFVVLMWVAGDGRDEEFHHTERPIAVSGLDP